MNKYIIGNAIIEISRPVLVEAEKENRTNAIQTALQQWANNERRTEL